MEGRFIYGEDTYVDEFYFDEVWEHISGFPEYMVSNKGRVWSEKTKRFISVKPLDDHGHLGVCLYRNGTPHYRYIHRLVAEAFVPNPEGLPIVRHIYDSPEQNTSDDLCWGTQRDNIRDSIKNGTAYSLTDSDRYKGNKNRMMAIVAINLLTGEKLYFQSQGEASRLLKIPQANIWKVLRGERARAGIYKFEEVHDD